MARPRVLVGGEAVTLAHVVRPLVLARALDPARYEIHFACARRYDLVNALLEPTAQSVGAEAVCA